MVDYISKFPRRPKLRLFSYIFCKIIKVALLGTISNSREILERYEKAVKHFCRKVPVWRVMIENGEKGRKDNENFKILDRLKFFWSNLPKLHSWSSSISMTKMHLGFYRCWYLEGSHTTNSSQCVQPSSSMIRFVSLGIT